MSEVEQQQNPHPLQDRNMDAFYELADAIAAARAQKHSWSHAKADGRSPASSDSQHSSRTPIRKRSQPRPPSFSSQLNLAQLAKQQVMAVHVENWRDDAHSVQQHIGMQHILGSLKRDEDENVGQAILPSEIDYSRDIPATPAWSEDSFLQLLRSPASDHASTSTKVLGLTPESPNEESSQLHHSPGHDVTDIATAALPGLNMALNIATISASERALFAGFAPKTLEDPHALNAEVLRSRREMMTSTSDETKVEERSPAIGEEHSRVATDFDEFIDFQPRINSNL